VPVFKTLKMMQTRRRSSPAPQPSSRSLWPLLFLILLVHLSQVLYTLPLNRVIELRLCEEHYGRTDAIPEKLCKIDEVQRKLAWLQGMMETTLVVCGS
jgi:hypothetical protein